MAKYLLTNKAVEDISKIWDYTYEVWSESQADKYYALLIGACQTIARKPIIARNYEKISNEIYGFGIGKHIIFYRNLSTKNVEIIRVLHELMDLRSKINE